MVPTGALGTVHLNLNSALQLGALDSDTGTAGTARTIFSIQIALYIIVLEEATSRLMCDVNLCDVQNFHFRIKISTSALQKTSIQIWGIQNCQE